MKRISHLLKALSYDTSAHFSLTTDTSPDPTAAHIIRAAKEAGVSGIYFVQPSREQKLNAFGIRPIVYVASAETVEQARLIHKRVWNIGYAPFLIINLGYQIRIYTGFDYQSDDETVGLLDQLENCGQELITALGAQAIDSGEIWETQYAKCLDPKRRVDYRLLQNLRNLGSVLKEEGLSDTITNALIGKYVYLSYLRDRKILSESWLSEQGVSGESIFSHQANVRSLRSLIEALDVRFNGQIFPLDFVAADTKEKLKDRHVSWVAAIFAGATLGSGAPKKIMQLHLPFQAYDFQYIPVEMLSAIYEQFILERKEKGAIYTPEVLADYLLSEVESVHSLEKGMKVLDPACGSGVFLVLAYRRIIESEMRKRGGERLSTEELGEIMLESIFGIERERDACYVAEFSLFLTLLHYINLDPPDLQRLHFPFPKLHNIRIFEGDFFDFENNAFWALRDSQVVFDWIVGNPPWVKAEAKEQPHALTWVTNNTTHCPVGGKSVAEAFSWLAPSILKQNGTVGFIMPATSLFNITSEPYRRNFFVAFTTYRITNFANLREVLFSKATLPAATFIYGKHINETDATEKPDILHYGPFSANQIQSTGATPWMITINECEIQAISHAEAEKGEGSLWKFALWGTHLDRRAYEQLSEIFPVNLKTFCKKNQLEMSECFQLREENFDSEYDCEYLSDLKDKKFLNANVMTDSCFRYNVDNALEDIPEEKHYIRKRGGKAGLKVITAPHIVMSSGWGNYLTFSNKPFVLPRGNIGIAGSEGKSSLLKALTIFLNSHVASYYVFFHSPQWGVFRQVKMVTMQQANTILVPSFTEAQVEKLSKVHDFIVDYERRFIQGLNVSHQCDLFEQKEPTALEIMQKKKEEILAFRKRIKTYISNVIFRMFGVPKDLRTILREFIDIKLLLDKTSAVENVTSQVSRRMLHGYGCQLRDELDAFALTGIRHKVSIWESKYLVECKIELIKKDGSVLPVEINNVQEPDLSHVVSKKMQKEFSQWVYVTRSIRVFQDSKALIVKPRRIMDWTKTQAMLDAGDFIGEALRLS
jgi:hypothetical protein